MSERIPKVSNAKSPEKEDKDTRLDMEKKLRELLAKFPPLPE